MKETITKEMIEKCQEIIRNSEYDFDIFKAEVGPMAPCSVTQSLFPEILDLALQHLKLKASHSLVEYIQPEPKTNNITYDIEEGVSKLKNKPLPLFDWRLAK